MLCGTKELELLILIYQTKPCNQSNQNKSLVYFPLNSCKIYVVRVKNIVNFEHLAAKLNTTQVVTIFHRYTCFGRLEN